MYKGSKSGGPARKHKPRKHRIYVDPMRESVATLEPVASGNPDILPPQNAHGFAQEDAPTQTILKEPGPAITPSISTRSINVRAIVDGPQQQYINACTFHSAAKVEYQSTFSNDWHCIYAKLLKQAIYSSSKKFF
ncbi:hypothetical protein Salat_1428700 [Sesamum alatum]|uniref:Uncharacterized protein n=1 Tax=Sesamum alatum TaxID=300844 RepID=A0AAE1YB69_9LAMI|nr:hypothetical protein Salat_1428700 [Sesamum alatum]